MKNHIFFILMLQALLTDEVFCQIDSQSIQNIVIGSWRLEKGGSRNSISLPHKSPIAKLKFEKCNNEVEMKRFNNPVIKRLRATDAFKEIRTVEFDTAGRVVDTAYWATRIYTNALDVSSYGLRAKKYFVITSISEDSIVIDRIDVYRKIFAPDTASFDLIHETPSSLKIKDSKLGNE